VFKVKITGRKGTKKKIVKKGRKREQKLRGGKERISESLLAEGGEDGLYIVEWGELKEKTKISNSNRKKKNREKGGVPLW